MAFTFFFRDAETLELAIEQMLPVAHEKDQIDIWDAGCAHGPEPYTLAILLREKMPEALFHKVRIHATDVDRGFAAQVNEGSFLESELRRLPPGILEKYFQPLGDSGRYRLVEEVRSKISFAHHDLLALRPFRKNLALIVCKNVLLHFPEDQRCQVLQMFHGAMCPKGVLVMEQTQKIPPAINGLFRQAVGYAQVFNKAGALPEAVDRTDSPACIRRPHYWNRVFRGKSLNDPL